MLVQSSTVEVYEREREHNGEQDRNRETESQMSSIQSSFIAGKHAEVTAD